VVEKLECTPWFDVRKGELPVRPGIYEITNFPVRGGFRIAPHRYFWDGICWGDSSRRRDPTRKPDSTVRYWRGVIPGADYPFDQVGITPTIYTGVLERAGTDDKITIQRLVIKSDEMWIAFERTFGHRESENYKTILHKKDSSFTGQSPIQVREFTNEKNAQLRIPALVESEGALTLTLILQGLTSDWYSFDGVLSSAP